VLNVKSSFAWAAVAAGSLVCLTAVPVMAQATGAPGTGRPIAPVASRPAGTNVAVIDISMVFEKYPKFQTQMKDLKTQVEEFEAWLRSEQQKLTKMREDLQGYTPGSQQFKDKEEEMAKFQSELQVKMALQRKDFLEKEARIYYDAYNEVYQAVATLADRNEIKLVLRFNSDEMKPEDRGSVLQGVNRAVVFQRNLNITNLVIRELGGDPRSTAPTRDDGPARKPAPVGTSNR